MERGKTRHSQLMALLSNPQAEELQGLPTTVTSEIHNKNRSGRTATKEISFALYLMDNYREELSLMDITRLVNEYFGQRRARITIMKWQRLFRPQFTIFFRLSREHYESWNKNISLSCWFRNAIKRQSLEGVK